ncbi:unnamed protein product [Calypogeia fissa]
MVRWRGPKSFIAAYHRFINNTFSSYGSYIAHRPLVPLCFGIILLGGFCFGLFKYSKESDLEKLWVEHGSQVVGQRDFFNSRFGGISRQEIAAIVTKDNPDAQLPLATAFDALTYSIAPLFDDLSWEYTVPGASRKANLTQADFCVRPLVPPLLGPGSNPLKDGNWLSYGYQILSTCALQATFGLNATNFTPLPQGWGIEKFPCTKLVPHDCFHEGGDFDYPVPLQQLEAVQPAIQGVVLTLVDITASNLQSNSCVIDLTNKINNTFVAAGVPSSVADAQVKSIVNGVVSQATSFYSWGYRWRKSYKGLSDQQIMDHINSALKNAEAWTSDPTNPQVASCILNNQACCLTWFGLHTPILSAFGSVTQDASGNVTKIGGIRWGQDNYNEDHPLWNEYISGVLQANFSSSQYKDMCKGWETQMINELLPLRNRENNLYSGNRVYSDLQFEFLTWRSVQDIISDSGKTPIWQIILSVVLTSLYAYLAFVNFRDPVHSHTWLVLTGMTVVSLAILCGFGFTALIGIKSSPIQGGVVPFLALAIGVDDVFVLSNTLRSYLSDPTVQAMGKGSLIPEREMRLTLALAGPSVILTTFTVLAAFFISSVNPMPISQWFCWQMGITATIHTIGLLLIFMPVMALDARRCKARINDPNLWLLKGIRNKGATAGPSAAVIESVDYSKEESLEDFDELDPSLQENTGSTPISRWVAKYYAPLFKSNIFKIAVVLFSIGLLVSMSYLGFKKLKHGLKLSDVTLTGSYQNTFAKLTEERFPNYDVYIVTGEIDYPTKQAAMKEIFDALETTQWAPPQPRIIESSFLGNVFLFANSTQGSPTPVPAQSFYPIEQGWSTSSLGVLSLQDLYCVDNNTKAQTSCFDVTSNPNVIIAASKSVLFAQNLGADTQPNLDMIKGTRKIVDDLNAKFGEEVAFMYGYPFLFYEQYLHSFHDLFLVVGFALVGVFVAVLIFQQSLVISLLICALLLITDLEVFGFIYILGAKLNALSLVNLGIVIGMSAEFTYLARSFLVVEGTKQHRVAKALEWTFEPLLHGFGVQFVATFPLLFVKYPAFRLYYFAMFTMMGIFAFFNGFFLLPAILTWIGPGTLHHIKEANAATSRAATARRDALEAGQNGKDENGNGVRSKNGVGSENPVRSDGASPSQ